MYTVFSFMSYSDLLSHYSVVTVFHMHNYYMNKSHQLYD